MVCMESPMCAIDICDVEEQVHCGDRGVGNGIMSRHIVSPLRHQETTYGQVMRNDSNENKTRMFHNNAIMKPKTLEGIHLIDCTNVQAKRGTTRLGLMGAELGIVGGGDAAGPGTTPDEDGWDTCGVWLGNVGISTVVGALTTGGIATLWGFKLFGGSGKSQGRGTRAAGIILPTRVSDRVFCILGGKVA